MNLVTVKLGTQNLINKIVEETPAIFILNELALAFKRDGNDTAGKLIAEAHDKYVKEIGELKNGTNG